MAEHVVKVKLPRRVEVFSKDLEVEVKTDGTLIGTLKISKGSLDWRDAKDHQSHVLRWGQFRELALKIGKKKDKQ